MFSIFGAFSDIKNSEKNSRKFIKFNKPELKRVRGGKQNMKHSHNFEEQIFLRPYEIHVDLSNLKLFKI